MSTIESQTASTVLDKLRDVLEITLGVNKEDCEPETTLVESLALSDGDIPELITNLRETFSISIRSGELAFLDEQSTVGDLVAYIEQRIEAEKVKKAKRKAKRTPAS